MASHHELACVYAVLILQEEDVAITTEKIQSIVTAAGVNVEPVWIRLFAKALEGVNVKELIANLNRGVDAAPAAHAPEDPAAAAPAEDPKKDEESKEESDDDMGFGLFD